MFIQTEDTPNPRTMKFIPGRPVLQEGTITFIDAEAAARSPLAAALFRIGDVDGVFFGSDFITVTRGANTQWDVLKPHVLTTIMEHFISGKPLLNDNNSVVKHSTHAEEDDELVKQIKELIDTRVRPAVAEDGGDIVYRSFDEGVVYLELRGACSGCPSSTATLKSGIENMLKHYVPEVVAVEAINPD